MWILQTKEDAEGKRLTYRLPDGSVKMIGRAPGADFILEAPLVSRLHCQLSSSADGRLDVKDMGSTNGTFVNGQRREEATLAEGDRIKVGRVELTVSRA